jgi:flagellar protein FlaF
VLIKDLALQGNKLPDGLKSNLIALGLWSMRYSTAAILQKLPVQPLIDVNRNIAGGIADQRAAVVPATSIAATTTA